jgi:hypothetical protein
MHTLCGSVCATFSRNHNASQDVVHDFPPSTRTRQPHAILALKSETYERPLPCSEYSISGSIVIVFSGWGSTRSVLLQSMANVCGQMADGVGCVSRTPQRCLCGSHAFYENFGMLSLSPSLFLSSVSVCPLRRQQGFSLSPGDVGRSLRSTELLERFCLPLHRRREFGARSS